MLDTNVCVDLIRGREEKVLNRLRACEMDEVSISSITLAELEFGVAKNPRWQTRQRNQLALVQFLAPLEILPFDHFAATSYGPIRSELERAGHPIGALDTLIAAHAMSYDLTLVTNNQREFGRVSELRTEDWR